MCPHAGGPGVDVILYILVTGCQLRALPRDYPRARPWRRYENRRTSGIATEGPTLRAGRNPYSDHSPHPSEPSIPSTGPRALRSRPAAPRELRGRSAVGVAPLVVTA